MPALNSDVTLTPHNGRWRWILNHLSATSFSQYSWSMTTDSKFSAIYHHVASMWHPNWSKIISYLIFIFGRIYQRNYQIHCSKVKNQLNFSKRVVYVFGMSSGYLVDASVWSLNIKYYTIFIYVGFISYSKCSNWRVQFRISNICFDLLTPPAWRKQQ